MTHDEISMAMTGNHGKCLAILDCLKSNEKYPDIIRDITIPMANEIAAEYENLVIKRHELWADESVDQDKWRGDHCGYLSAQCKARTLRGLKPTPDQAEAWFSCNTNTAQLSAGAI